MAIQILYARGNYKISEQGLSFSSAVQEALQNVSLSEDVYNITKQLQGVYFKIMDKRMLKEVEI